MELRLKAESGPEVPDSVVSVESIAAASEVTWSYIHQHRLNEETFAGGEVIERGVTVARVDYNGKVWAAGGASGDDPLFVPTVRYRSHFPDFGPMDVVIPQGFDDLSGMERPCPEFVNDEFGLRLLIDYADAEQRAFETTGRFTLAQLDGSGRLGVGAVIWETDVWAEIAGDLDVIRNTTSGIKAEVVRLVQDRVVPIVIGRFSDLHKYVDANTLGDVGAELHPMWKAAYESPAVALAHRLLEPADRFCAMLNAVQRGVDRWIKNGEMKTEAKVEGAPPEARRATSTARPRL